MDPLHEEAKKIERDYRIKIVVYTVLCALGLVWGLGKLVSAHLAVTG